METLNAVTVEEVAGNEGATADEAIIANAMMKDLPTREEAEEMSAAERKYHEQFKCEHRYRTTASGFTCRKCGTVKIAVRM